MRRPSTLVAALVGLAAACAARPPTSAVTVAPLEREPAVRVTVPSAPAIPASALAPPRVLLPVWTGNVRELGVGDRRVCGLDTGGAVRCRALPEGPTVTRDVPRSRSIVTGGDRGCVRGEDGTTWCWGHAWWCGAGERLDPELPARIEGLSDDATVALPPTRLRDSGAGLLALTSAGLVRGLWCDADQRGESAEFGGAVTQLALGRNTGCALLRDGALQCREDLGPLQRVVGVASPRAVHLGVGHGCALDAAGGVACWPVCEYREGDGGRGVACGAWEPRRRRRRAPTPPEPAVGPDIRATRLAGLPALTALALGEGFGCGVTPAQGVTCWRMAVPRRRSRHPRRARRRALTPFTVAGLEGVTRLGAEASTLCALRADGTVWCVSRPAPGATATRVAWD